MAHEQSPTAAHFSAFRSAREEVGTEIIQNLLNKLDEGSLENEAVYFSRRAREERHASIHGACRKCRDVHLELAEAYEFRAHLVTQQLQRRAGAELMFAL
jgi:hypothetical protein